MLSIALYGGKPVRDNVLPYGRQVIEEDDIESVVEILKSDFLTTGPTVLAFEKLFAEFVGAKYAVAVANGTAALHIACLAAGVENGDEVITSPMTFAASSNSILYCGGKPVFADIDYDSMNIDPNQIKNLIGDRTKALIPVHYAGLPCKMDEIMTIANEKGLIVIEDASHALGAQYNDVKIGNIGDMTTFSLHPVKHITTGEGGMVTTNSEEFYNKLLLYRTHGITRNNDLMKNESHGPWYYEQLELGYNYRITDFQCALGISQLKKSKKYQDVRNNIVNMYNEAFGKLPGIQLQHKNSSEIGVSHLYVIRIDPSIIKTDRLTFFKALHAEGIGANVHYLPVYMHPYYQNNGYADVKCVNAERAYQQMLSLPLFHGMTEHDAYDVIEAVKKLYDYFSN